MSDEVRCDSCSQVMSPKKCDACEQPIIEEPRQTSLPTLLFVAVVAVAVIIAVSFVPLFYFGFPAEANAFGDSFGFGNALVSACAFAALIITMFWQKQELEMQRHEIRQMREASQDSAEAQRDSHIAMRQTATIAALSELRRAAELLVTDDDPIKQLTARIVRNRIEHSLVSLLEKIAPTDSADEVDGSKDIAIRIMQSAVELMRERDLFYSTHSVRPDLEHLPDQLVWEQGDRVHEEISILLDSIDTKAFTYDSLADIRNLCSRSYCEENSVFPLTYTDGIKELQSCAENEVEFSRPILLGAIK